VVDQILAALEAHARPAREVRVDLGERGYDIVIGEGLIASAGARIKALFPKARAAVVTDENVAAHWLEPLRQSFAAAGVEMQTIICPAGETTKSYAEFARVSDTLIAARIERRDIVVALGGGVIGDLAGFAAATLRRGVDYVQIPTSLLAQVDSSVGGKTAINSPLGKNLVGAFHQPRLVLADAGALRTLPHREFRAGYAEVVKYGLIDDRAFFEWLEAHWREIFAGGPARAEAIAVSCAAKARIVASDETEQGARALLNLGHTFGHALEALARYDPAILVHGEGVAVGLACAFRFSQALGHGNGQDAVRVENHLKAVGLPTRIQDVAGLTVTPEQMLEAMRQDKKVERGRLTFILARGIGESFIAKDVNEAEALKFLETELAPR
jgi:3-dehydroquinate synthase